MFFSESFCIILATAISKSSWVTWTRLSLRAYIPASVQVPLTSAPELPPICSAIFLRLIPLVKFILLL